jgi:hypothetical protein
MKEFNNIINLEIQKSKLHASRNEKVPRPSTVAIFENSESKSEHTKANDYLEQA